jgi:hypothetical protein
MAMKMVTAFGSLRWWTDANPTEGFHKKNGFVSFGFDIEESLHAVYFKEKDSVLKLELPPVSAWINTKSMKLYKESLLVDNCRLRSVMLLFSGVDGGLHRIQLSFAIEVNDYGVVNKDHGKLFLLAIEKGRKGEDDW